MRQLLTQFGRHSYKRDVHPNAQEEWHEDAGRDQGDVFLSQKQIKPTGYLLSVAWMFPGTETVPHRWSQP